MGANLHVTNAWVDIGLRQFITIPLKHVQKVGTDACIVDEIYVIMHISIALNIHGARINPT